MNLNRYMDLMNIIEECKTYHHNCKACTFGISNDTGFTNCFFKQNSMSAFPFSPRYWELEELNEKVRKAYPEYEKIINEKIKEQEVDKNE